MLNNYKEFLKLTMKAAKISFNNKGKNGAAKKTWIRPESVFPEKTTQDMCEPCQGGGSRDLGFLTTCT